MLREMTAADLPGVNALLVRAFSAARRHEGSRHPHLPLCSAPFLRYYLEETPSSCWVVSEGLHIHGAVFGHSWGLTGWIGPLAVSPERQNQGWGRALLRHAVEALEAAGCRTIGLETDAGSVHNLAFYTRIGYRPGLVLADLVRSDRDARGIDEELWQIRSYGQHPALFEEYLPQFLLDQRIEADYLGLARRVHERRFGDCYLALADGGVAFFAALQLVPVSIQESAGVGRVMALVGPSQTEVQLMDHFLQLVAGMAELQHLVVRVSTRYHGYLLGLQRQGWRLLHSHLRFYYSGADEAAAGVHLNKWD